MALQSRVLSSRGSTTATRLQNVGDTRFECEALVRLSEKFLSSPLDGLGHYAIYGLLAPINYVIIHVFFLHNKHGAWTDWRKHMLKRKSQSTNVQLLFTKILVLAQFFYISTLHSLRRLHLKLCIERYNRQNDLVNMKCTRYQV